MPPIHHRSCVARIYRALYHSGGADCKNDPQSAPPDFDLHPQPTETEGLITK